MTTNKEILNHRDGSVITFYSYKGGVGRTMALANLACLIAKREKKILLIDWDLEAPGLHHFFNYNNTEQQGLIDLVTDVKSKLDDGKIENTDYGYVSFFNDNLSQYICKDLYIDYIGEEKRYELDLLKSGRLNSGYTTKLNDFDWIKFYKISPSFFRTFANYLESKYDYILIDSRTGFADTSGICTMLMPERLVLVFSPNDQNIEGVLNVAKQAREYRLNSYDERTLAVFPLPARIDSNNPDKRIEWLDKYTSIFQKFFVDNYYLEECSLKNYFEKATIRYTHQYAYGETISVLTESTTDKLSIAYDYENFLNILLSNEPIWELQSREELAKNEKEILDLFIKGYEFQSNNEYDKAIAEYSKAIELKPDYANIYNSRGIAYKNLLNYDSAITNYNKAIELKPDFADAYYNRGITYSDLKQYDKAIADYNKAIKIKPDYADAYYNRAFAYNNLKQYNKSIADYTKAIELKPKDVQAYNNRGIAYKNLKKYDRAIADYSKAIELKPDYAFAYYNRGNSYSKLKRYNETIADFTKAIELKPEDVYSYNNRGIAYKNLKIYDKAIADYSKAIELKPDYSNVYDNMGYCYLNMKNYRLAEINFNKCLELNDKEIDAIIGLSILYFEIQDFENSKKWMEKATLINTVLKEGMKGIEQIEKEGMIYESGNKETLKKLFILLGK